MIGNDRHHAAWLQTFTQLGKRTLQCGELVVHGNAQRLKEPGEVRWSRPRPKRSANRTDQVVADGKGPVPSAPNDLASQSMGAVLVAVLAEDGCQGMLIERVEQLRGGEPVGARAPVHAHVEGSVFAEGEASARIVDLVRRNAEVEQDAREPIVRELGDLIKVGEIAEVGSKPALRREWSEARTHGI